jgi:hypothetical protein
MSLRDELRALVERWREGAEADRENARRIRSRPHGSVAEESWSEGCAAGRRQAADELAAVLTRSSETDDVLEMRLRDTRRLALQPNRLYRFLDEAGDTACAKCGKPIGKQACTVCGGINYHFLDREDGRYSYRCCDCGLAGGGEPCLSC